MWVCVCSVEDGQVGAKYREKENMRASEQLTVLKGSNFKAAKQKQGGLISALNNVLAIFFM